MSTCSFCDVTTDTHNKILQDYPKTILLMANQRKVFGQLLVIPKRHVERVSQLTPAERVEIFDVIADIEERIVRHFKSGCDVTQHYKPYMAEDGFKVSHLHFHVLPRYSNDGLAKIRADERSLYRHITEAEVTEVMRMFDAQA